MVDEQIECKLSNRDGTDKFLINFNGFLLLSHTQGYCYHLSKFHIYALVYCIGVISPGSMHDTGCLGLVHWDDPEGWYGEGGGFRMGNTCIPVVDSF